MTLVATAIGLVLLFSFKTPDSLPVAERPVSVAIASPEVRGSVASDVPSTRRSGSSAVPATPVPSASTATAGGTRQVDGDVVATQFGDVQVRVIESSGKITDVQAIQLPFDRRRSQEISQYVEPYLRSEALQAQSAQIDTISGATYTSEAYSASLQSAIVRAGG